MSIYYTKYM